MKKTLLLLCLICSFFAYSQSPSSTKKWNDLLDRYEYFDGQGNKIGYEKYNNLYNRWEYFSEDNYTYKRDRKTFDLESTLSISDIEYARAIAQARANQTSQIQKSNEIAQNNYSNIHNKNQKVLQKVVDGMFTDITVMDISEELKTKLEDELNDLINIENKNNNKLYSDEALNKAILFYENAFNDIKEKHFYRNLTFEEKFIRDGNFDFLQSKINGFFEKFRQLNVSKDTKQKMFDEMNLHIQFANICFIQLSKKETFLKALNYYESVYEYIIQKYVKNNGSKQMTSGESYKVGEKDAKNFGEESGSKDVDKGRNIRTELENKFFNNEHQKVIDLTSQLIKNKKNNMWYVYYYRARSNILLENYNEAIQNLHFLIRNYDSKLYEGYLDKIYFFLAESYYGLAQKYYSLKNYQNASKYVSKALDLDESNGSMWGTKGAADYFLGKYNESIEAMDKSIAIKPESNSFLYRGMSKIKLGRKTEGCDDIKEALAIDNENSIVKENFNKFCSK